MPSIEWNDISDWDSSHDSSGIDHNNDPYTSSSPGKLKQGYQKQWPPMTHGLVGWWPLHTDKPVDLSGNGNHGTKNGGVTTGVAGKAGLQAYSFDGGDDYIDLGSAPSSEEEYAVAFWIRPEDGSSRQRIIDSVGDYVIFFGDSDNDIDIATYDDNSFGEFTEHSMALGKWHFVYIHYISGAEYAVSIDGQKLETVSTTDGSVDGGRAWAIGTDADSTGSANFEGELCDMRVYSRALSQSEIQTLYNWGSSDQASPPTDGVSRYALDGDVTDAWGSNDGTNNGATFVDDAIRGKSARFNSSENDYIQLPDVDELSPTGDFSVGAWFKPKSTGYLIGNYNNDIVSERQWVLYIRDSPRTVSFAWYDSSDNYQSVYPDKTHPLNTWSQAHVNFQDGDRIEIWINGEIMATHESNVSIRSIGGGPIIGADATGSNRNFNGYIDSPYFFNKTLSPKEIQEIYRYGTRGIDMNKFTVMQ